MIKYETTFIYVLSEKRARDKIREWYDDKEDLRILYCIPGQKGDKGYEVKFSYDEPKKELSLEESNVCSVCGKKIVKLWRLYGDSDTLICAECEEEREYLDFYGEKL